MSINLGRVKELSDTNDEGKWFDYDDAISFKLRYVSPEAGRKLRMKHTKKVWKKGQLIEQVDDKAYSKALADFVLADWKGVLDVDDVSPAPCTLENKEILLDGSTDHATFIYETARDINNFMEGSSDEDLMGNSESG